MVWADGASGGKREASDTNLKATVIRETFEETGLH